MYSYLFSGRVIPYGHVLRTMVGNLKRAIHKIMKSSDGQNSATDWLQIFGCEIIIPRVYQLAVAHRIGPLLHHHLVHLVFKKLLSLSFETEE